MRSKEEPKTSSLLCTKKFSNFIKLTKSERSFSVGLLLPPGVLILVKAISAGFHGIMVEYLPAGIVPITISEATCNNTLKPNRAGLYVIE